MSIGIQVVQISTLIFIILQLIFSNLWLYYEFLLLFRDKLLDESTPPILDKLDFRPFKSFFLFLCPQFLNSMKKNSVWAVWTYHYSLEIWGISSLSFSLISFSLSPVLVHKFVYLYINIFISKLVCSWLYSIGL